MESDPVKGIKKYNSCVEIANLLTDGLLSVMQEKETTVIYEKSEVLTVFWCTMEKNEDIWIVRFKTSATDTGTRPAVNTVCAKRSDTYP